MPGRWLHGTKIGVRLGLALERMKLTENQNIVSQERGNPDWDSPTNSQLDSQD
jgi:hypothetical protein